MRRNVDKFNPAVLPAEVMKGFEHDEKPASAPKHFLYPGQMFASREPKVITTILGSCAALCLWDRRKKIGGMNHYLLPDGADSGPNRLRYGNVANPALLNELLAMGCRVEDLQAKLFGGSSAFSANPEQSVGSRNSQLAEEFLRSAGIPLVAKDVMGKRGRKLIFHTQDGITQIRDFAEPPSSEPTVSKSKLGE
jgi:chemotaxis protein CheD